MQQEQRKHRKKENYKALHSKFIRYLLCTLFLDAFLLKVKKCLARVLWDNIKPSESHLLTVEF